MATISVTKELGELTSASAQFACAFAHEKSDQEMAPLCPNSIRESRLGCPHGDAVVRIHELINAFRDHELLDQVRAQEMHYRLEDSERQLLQVDGAAQKEYSLGNLSPDIV